MKGIPSITNIHFPADKTIRFVSEPQPSIPAFRLSYSFTDTSIMAINFEISPDGKEEPFKTYVKGTAQRK